MSLTLTDPAWFGLPSTDQYRRLLEAVDPNGDAPGSRYGTHPTSWATYAVAVLYISEYHTGGFADWELSEVAYAYASQTVNDSPNIAETIVDYWHVLPRALRIAIGTKTRTRSLIAL